MYYPINNKFKVDMLHADNEYAYEVTTRDAENNITLMLAYCDSYASAIRICNDLEEGNYTDEEIDDMIFMNNTKEELEYFNYIE